MRIYGGTIIAQINLTPTESKKLMAKAIARMEPVKRATRDGMIVIHPSSSTYFLTEELTGENPKYDNWICGSITPRGLCMEMGIMSNCPPRDENKALDPGRFPFSVVDKGSKAAPVANEKLYCLPVHGLPFPCRKENVGPMSLRVLIPLFYDLNHSSFRGNLIDLVNIVRCLVRDEISRVNGVHNSVRI